MSGKRDDSEGSGGTHGGMAIGRTTGMGAGIADGGTPGPDEGSGDDEESPTGGGDAGGGGTA
jgi:hypothetical protein